MLATSASRRCARVLQNALKLLDQLRGLKRLVVVPEQLRTQPEQPDAPFVGMLPVMRQIADRLIRFESRQAGKELTRQVLFGAPDNLQRRNGIERAIVGDAQHRGVVLPLAAHQRTQQIYQPLRRHIQHLQRFGGVARLQLRLQQLLPQLFGRSKKGQRAQLAAPRLALPAEPACMLPMGQQGAQVAIAAKAAAGHLGHAGLLGGALALLPQALKLIKAIKLAHSKPGTVFEKYSLLVPGLPSDSEG